MTALRANSPALLVLLALAAVALSGQLGGAVGGWAATGLFAAVVLVNSRSGFLFTLPLAALPGGERAADASRTDDMAALVSSQDTSRAAPSRATPWQVMLEGIPDPALLLDGRGYVLRANPPAAVLFPGDAGRHISLINRSPELLAAVERALATGMPHSFEVRSVVPVERTLAGLVTPLRGRESVARPEPALMLVIRDHTAESQLAQMRADFVANASHELRTPLSSLKGFVETLQGAAKDDPVARDKFLGIMQLQATRMSRLIEDLLSLSRIEMHEHVPPTGRVDLAAVIADVVAALRPLGETARIAISVASGENAIVAGDRDELAQVVQNLIQNAIKYGRPGGEITVSLATAANRVVLSVSDNGIGIAPEHLPRLTERFYRVSAKDSRERGGTGLGLAIVKHIVNRHHGALEITSKVGAGSVFAVRLPVA